MPHTAGIKLLLARLPAVLFLCSTPPAFAQWRNAPEPNAPRTPSGDVDLEAPPPRHANGRVDLAGHLDARRQPLHPRSRARHRRRQSSVPALGAPPVRRAQGRLALARGPRRALPAARRAEDRLRVVSMEAHRDAELRRHGLRDVHVLAADLHRRPHSGPDREAGVDGLLDGPLGRRHAGRRDDGLQRQAGSTSSAARPPTACA